MRLPLCDFHVHTRHSPCGKPEMTVEAVVRRCEEIGLNAVGLTDHCGIYRDDGDRVPIVEEIRALDTSPEISEFQVDRSL